MSKTQDKAAILRVIQQVATDYNNNMVGKVFLYVFEGHAIEVIFRRKDFLHLTGVDTAQSSEQFFKNVMAGLLRPNQIYFSKRHPYDLCAKKIVKLPNLATIINSEVLVLEDLATDTFTYKFGVTDLEFTVCLSKDTDKNGNVVSNHYIARSLRVEDSFPKAGDAYEINFIFSKMNNERLYKQLMYSDGKVDIASLDKSILDKLDDSLKVSTESSKG